MDMGEDDTFMATLETNKQHALSLLDLPNPRSDTTDSLTPHKLNNKGGSNHNNTENTTTKLSTNYYQTRTARRANHTQETHNLDTGTTTHTQQ